MATHDLYIAERTMHARLSERRRHVQERLLRRQARIGQPGWAAQRTHWLAGKLGLRLVALGGRLVAYGLPAYRTKGDLGSRTGNSAAVS